MMTPNQKRWRLANKDRLNAAWRDRYANDPGFRAKLAEQKKVFYAQNQEHCSAIRLKTRYKITPEELDLMIERQAGLCAICCEPMKPGFLTHIDHDHSCCPKSGHSCGKCIRGLLCHPCNVGLGQYEKMSRLPVVEYLSGRAAPADPQS